MIAGNKSKYVTEMVILYKSISDEIAKRKLLENIYTSQIGHIDKLYRFIKPYFGDTHKMDFRHYMFFVIVHVIEIFDASKGCQFSTVVNWWYKAKTKEYLFNNGKIKSCHVQYNRIDGEEKAKYITKTYSDFGRFDSRFVSIDDEMIHLKDYSPSIELDFLNPVLNTMNYKHREILQKGFEMDRLNGNGISKSVYKSDYSEQRNIFTIKRIFREKLKKYLEKDIEIMQGR